MKKKKVSPTSIRSVLDAAAGSGVGLVHLEKFAKDFATAQINAAVARAMERMQALLSEPIVDAEDPAVAAPMVAAKGQAKTRKRKALGRGMGDISRTDQVINVLRRKGQLTLAQICGAIGPDAEQKVYGTACLSLVKRKLAKRRKVDGVYVYTLIIKAA